MPTRMTKSAGPHPVDIAIGKRVRLRRLQLSMSQSELAEQLGMTFQQIQKYETGANRISCSKLTEIADALDSPITFFFSDENEPSTDMKHADNLDPAHIKDGLRLITAFGQIDKKQRKKVLAGVPASAVALRSGNRALMPHRQSRRHSMLRSTALTMTCNTVVIDGTFFAS